VSSAILGSPGRKTVGKGLLLYNSTMGSCREKEDGLSKESGHLLCEGLM
jgi:hypothetical protein